MIAVVIAGSYNHEDEVFEDDGGCLKSIAQIALRLEAKHRDTPALMTYCSTGGRSTHRAHGGASDPHSSAAGQASFMHYSTVHPDAVI